MIKKEIEQFLTKHWGNYSLIHSKKNFHIQSVSYAKRLIVEPTILMVVKPPIDFDPLHGSYGENGEPIKFFLHDMETDLNFGCISQIPIDDDWRVELTYRIYTAESRMKRSKCPECGFWLLERMNQHLHPFIGCSGFPDCEFSAEVGDIYDDENGIL